MSLGKKIAWNTGVQVAGRAIKMGINVLLFSLIMQLFGAEGLGHYETVFAYVALFELIADMGLNTIITKWVTRREEAEASRIIGNVLGLRLALSLLMLGLLFGTLPFFQYSSEENVGILLASLSTVSLLFNAVMMGIFQIKLCMERHVLGDLVGVLVTLLLTLLVWWQGGNFLLVIAAKVAGNVVWLLISLYYGYRAIPFGFLVDRKLWQEIMHEALPIGMAIILWRVYYRADTLLLRSLPVPDHIHIPTGKDAQAFVVGVYGAAYRFFDLLVSLPGMFMVATFPVLAKYAFSDRPRFLSLYQKSFNVIIVLAFPMVTGIFWLADATIAFVAQDTYHEFVEAGTILQLLALAAFFNFFNSLNNGVIVAVNKHNRLLVLNFFAVIVNIAGNLWVIPRYSHIGAAGTTMATECLVFFASFFIIHQAKVQLPHFQALGSVLLATTLMAGTLYITDTWHLVFRVLLAGSCFFLTLGLVNREMLAQVKSMFKRGKN